MTQIKQSNIEAGAIGTNEIATNETELRLVLTNNILV